MKNIDNIAINTIRILSVDSVENANSGHPGLPLGAAPAAYTLWSKFLKHNPNNPSWEDRDRFVLSAGHGSALLYSLLHLFGYGLKIDDLKQFRQLDSLTPGHPEYKHTTGVEVTTGPLGQGIANAVGMAWAESYLSKKFNEPNFNIVDHYTYVLCGDGCLQEGVALEAISLAGSLELGKLILLYDSNNITIEGNCEITFREDVLKKFDACGWHTVLVEDGNDVDAISNAIEEAKNVNNKPSIIKVNTKIGFGSPNKQGKSSAHGEPLGKEEIKLTKQALGFDPEKSFYVPKEVTEYIEDFNKNAKANNENWNKLFEEYKKEFPQKAEQWDIWHSLDIDINNLLDNDDFWNYNEDLATRVSSEKVLNKLSKLVPNLIGGSADLSPSTKTIMKDRESYSKDNRGGSNLHFGIREHAMAAIANGMYLHGGLRPYISSFFVFSDYMKPAMRLSALMKLPVISVLTHDSIGVGEDGPTHQPIEQLASLRSIPNYTVIRPCDTNETAAAWYLALTRKESPSAIILTRQKVKLLGDGKKALKGAYILKDCENKTPEIIFIATGSEVELACNAYEELKNKGISSRVISMPSMEIFEEQSDDYKESVLPKNIRKRIAIEAGCSFGWWKYVGLDGDVISMDTFGASAPASQLFEKFGFTTQNIVNKALKLLDK